jgi:hypothetical protein
MRSARFRTDEKLTALNAADGRSVDGQMLNQEDPLSGCCRLLGMERSMDHRGTNFEVVELSPMKWRWTIYPKKSSAIGKVTREVTGTRQQATANCKLEIDRKLARQRNAQRT